MPISTRELSGLPDLIALEKLTQSIAMLDAIISPEWEYRYFSFNRLWDEAKNERMASMRNGSGDEYFLVFGHQGAFLKGFDHEAIMSPWDRESNEVWPGVLDHVPAEFSFFLREPAFSMDDTTFCLWRGHDDVAWHCGPVSFPSGDDPDGSENLLWMLDGRPETYVEFASDYYEKTINVDSVRKLYRQDFLTPSTVSEINAERNFNDILADAAEIGYPVATHL